MIIVNKSSWRSEFELQSDNILNFEVHDDQF